METSLANDRMLIWATILFVLVQLFVVVSNEQYWDWNFPSGSKLSRNEISKTVKVFSRQQTGMKIPLGTECLEKFHVD